MTDKFPHHARQRRRIHRFLDKWVVTLGLGPWTLDQVYSSGELPKELAGGPDSVVHASCNVSWEYQRARISWNCNSISDLDDDQLERVVIHELCHVLVAQMCDYRSECGRFIEVKHEEATVTRLTNAIKWIEADARRRGEREAKRARSVRRR